MRREIDARENEIPKPYPCRKCDGRGIRIWRSNVAKGIFSPDVTFVDVDKCKACDGWGLIFPRRRASTRTRRTADFDAAALLHSGERDPKNRT